MLRDLLFQQADFGSFSTAGVQLKRVYQRNLRRAFSWSAGAHLLAGLLCLGVLLYLKATQGDKALGVRLVRYADLGPPPSIADQAAAPQIQVSAAAARPTVGIPEPVPDAEVSEEATISTQTELSQMTSLVTPEVEDSTTVVQQEQRAKKEEIVVEEDKLPAPGDFIPVEQNPVPIEMPAMAYPEIARRAGIEGTVFVRMLVDKTGRVRDVLVDKGPEVFYPVVKEAALKSIWRPAIQNKRPVAVWVGYPIRFKLN